MFTTYLEKSTSLEAFWGACKHAFCPNLFYDSWVDEMLNRYNYCKEFNTPAYPGSYDDQPAVWMEAQRLIGGAIGSLSECGCDKHGKK